MLTVRIQEKNYSESIMVLKLKDGHKSKIPYFSVFLKLPKKIINFFKKSVAK